MSNESEKYFTTDSKFRSSYGLRLNPVELANLVDDSNPAFGGYSGRGPSGSGRGGRNAVSDEEFEVLSYEGRSPNRVCVRGADIEAATEDPAPKSREAKERVGGLYRYRFRPTGTIRLLSYEGHAEEVVIPDRIEGIRVTALASNLFQGRDDVERIVIPDTVEYIGHHAFAHCSRLASVRMPARLRTIASTAFSGCASLEEVAVTSPFVQFDRRLFSDCPITQVTLGPSVERLANEPWHLPHLASITVSEENTNLATDGTALFTRGAGGALKLVKLIVPVESYDVPKECRAIGGRAFDSAESLRFVALPEGIARIGRFAFAKTSIASLDIPSSVESIGEKAFYQCASLRKLALHTGLRSIGEEAFAFSGIERISLPASLRDLGMRAFAHTPAERGVGRGSILIDDGNDELAIDANGGLYRGDTFLELIGLPDEYTVRQGTRIIAEGACKRHRTLARVVIPAGVEVIGSEAFSHNRRLIEVELPDTLCTIGEGAFADTSLRSLSIGPRVTAIGKDALIVQGTNQLSPRVPLQRLELSPHNPRYYLQNGMLCERDGSPSGGDAVVVYIGPDSTVSIPDQVTQIDDLAFCGVDGVDEIAFHPGIRSICSGSLTFAHAPRRIHVPLPEAGRPTDAAGAQQAEGAALLDERGMLVLRMPRFTSRYRTMMPLFRATKAGLAFDFGYYDIWVAHSADMDEFAPAAVERLSNPVALTQDVRTLYENTIRRKAVNVCVCLASKGRMDALRWLHRAELISDEAVEQALHEAMSSGNAQETACLLELRHTQGKKTSPLDFDL